MKIERPSVVITEIPYFDSIEVMPSGILLTRGTSEQTCHVADIEALRDALTEAIRIKREGIGTSTSAPAPRAWNQTWNEVDSEPGMDVKAVQDCEGDTWYHIAPNCWSTQRDDPPEISSPWGYVIGYVPLIEVRDV